MADGIRSNPSTGCRRTGRYTGSHELQVLDSVQVIPPFVIQRPWKEIVNTKFLGEKLLTGPLVLRVGLGVPLGEGQGGV